MLMLLFFVLRCVVVLLRGISAKLSVIDTFSEIRICKPDSVHFVCTRLEFVKFNARACAHTENDELE